MCQAEQPARHYKRAANPQSRTGASTTRHAADKAEIDHACRQEHPERSATVTAQNTPEATVAATNSRPTMVAEAVHFKQRVEFVPASQRVRQRRCGIYIMHTPCAPRNRYGVKPAEFGSSARRCSSGGNAAAAIRTIGSRHDRPMPTWRAPGQCRPRMPPPPHARHCNPSQPRAPTWLAPAARRPGHGVRETQVGRAIRQFGYLHLHPTRLCEGGVPPSADRTRRTGRTESRRPRTASTRCPPGQPAGRKTARRVPPPLQCGQLVARLFERHAEAASASTS